MEIVEWLRGLGLAQYEPAFRENAIDESVLPSLTAEDLKDLGVTAVGHRRKLLAAIAALGAEPVAPPLAAAGPLSSPERRQLTVMFCDLVGSTALAAKLDPEDLREVIGAYHRCVADTVARFGGFVAKYMGDGVLVYFGYPQAHEDDVERAAMAALELAVGVAALTAGGDTELACRIGIATGLVVVGDLLGAGSAQEQTVVGETPNLAARLQALAEPGTVLVDARTHRLVGDLFEYRDLGVIEVKGFEERQHAWRILGKSRVLSRFEALRSHESPLLGREEEMELLRRRWRQAKTGAGQVILVSGEAGIGKSRLVAAILEELGDEPHTRLRYFCSPHHADSALYPVIGQLEFAAGFEPGELPRAKLEKLDALLSPMAASTEDRSLIAELLSLPLGDPRFPALDLTPQIKKQRTLDALSRAIENLVRQQPLLVIVEDTHWIDPTSLEWLDRTVEEARKLRVLLLVTFRREFAPAWIGQQHVTALGLRRLATRESVALAAHVTGNRALPPELLEEIVNRADGVPLFLEELTKAVVEAGTSEAGKVVAAAPSSRVGVPATLYASLAARLDRLGPAKEIAQIGTVIGREFAYDLIRDLAALPEMQLAPALDTLVASELVFRRGTPPAASYGFKHALIQEAAYETLLRNERRRLHERLADLLEKRPETADQQPELLAHHYAEAGLHEKAAAYWLRAGKRSAARWANREAVSHLRRGIVAVAALADGRAKDRMELEFQYALGPCLIATEGVVSARALETFARARDLCERLGEAPEYPQVMHWLCTVYCMRGELALSLEASEANRALAKVRGDRPALANAARGCSFNLLLMGRLAEALERSEEAVAAFNASSEAERLISRAAGQDAGVASLAMMSWTLWILGFPDIAAKQIATALDRAGATADPHSETYARYYASVVHALRGEPETALRHAERCLALSEEHGLHWRGLARMIAGIAARVIDPSSGSLDAVRSEFGEYVRRGYQMGITALYVLLCEALLRQGKPDSAIPLLAEALGTTREERMFEAELQRLRGRAMLDAARPEARAEAQSMFEEALKTARRQGARSLELRAASSLARLLGDAGRENEARDLLAPLYDWFSEGFETADLKEAKALLDALS